MSNIVAWLLSYFFLSVIGSLLYVALIIGFFVMMKKLFHMDEEKWSKFFKFKNNIGLYMVILLPFIMMLAVIFWASKVWFDFIQIEHSLLCALAVIAILTITLIFNLPKLKKSL